jgi:glycerol-3-phosphate dehydrogenase
MPHYKDDKLGPAMLKTGLWMYDLLAGRGQPVSRHNSFTKHEIFSKYSFLKTQGLKSGSCYGDCQMDDARFTLDVIERAYMSGAIIANYLAADEYITDKNIVTGAIVQDQLTKDTFTIKAKRIVNATGPWKNLVENHHFLTNYMRFSKGIHLVMPQLPTRDALLLMTENDDRIFFLVPWYGKTLVGTTDSNYTGDPDKIKVEKSDIDYLLKETNRYLKDCQWDYSSIISKFAGLRALKNEPGKPPSQVTREWTMFEPKPGLFISVGGKFTSARADAANIVNQVMESLDMEPPKTPPTATLPLPSSPGSSFAQWKKSALKENINSGLDKEVASFLIFRHGTKIKQIREIIEQNTSLAQRISPDLPFSKAEIIYSARHEMVITLEDLVRRRIPITILSCPNKTIMEKIADQVATIKNWDKNKIKHEVDQVMENW